MFKELYSDTTTKLVFTSLYLSLSRYIFKAPNKNGSRNVNDSINILLISCIFYNT